MSFQTYIAFKQNFHYFFTIPYPNPFVISGSVLFTQKVWQWAESLCHHSSISTERFFRAVRLTNADEGHLHVDCVAIAVTGVDFVDMHYTIQ